MKVHSLGSEIKRRRKELGITQEQLCEGICEPVTISRLETGKQMPSLRLLNALLEKLDLNIDKYSAYLYQNELEIDALQKEIEALNLRFAQAAAPEKPAIREKALAVHRELQLLAGDTDPVCQQAILRSRVLLGSDEGSYPLETQRELLLDALRLTCPAFDMKDIAHGLYTTYEIKIINQIATIYGKEGDHLQAIDILAQLYAYVYKHHRNMPRNKGHLNMILFNYTREVRIVGQYQKAAELAEEGHQLCVELGHYLSLFGFLDILAECYYNLGEHEKSKDYYYQSYYLCKAVGDIHNLEIIRKDAKQFLNLVFDT